MIDRAAMALSLRHGGGDLRWFDKLPREDKVRLVAHYQVQAAETRKPARGGRGGSGAPPAGDEPKFLRGVNFATPGAKAFWVGGGRG